MNTSNRFAPSLLGALVIGIGMTVAAPAFAAGSQFIKIESHRGFNATVSALKEAVSSNQMMVMGNINQARMLSMTGLKLEGAESFLIGNAQAAKMAFSMNPAVSAELPVRVSVWADHGKTFIGYFLPSSQLEQIGPGFNMMGNMLDKKLDMITQAAAK